MRVRVRVRARARACVRVFVCACWLLARRSLDWVDGTLSVRHSCSARLLVTKEPRRKKQAPVNAVHLEHVYNARTQSGCERKCYARTQSGCKRKGFEKLNLERK